MNTLARGRRIWTDGQRNALIRVLTFVCFVLRRCVCIWNVVALVGGAHKRAHTWSLVIDSVEYTKSRECCSDAKHGRGYATESFAILVFWMSYVDRDASGQGDRSSHHILTKREVFDRSVRRGLFLVPENAPLRDHEHSFTGHVSPM